MSLKTAESAASGTKVLISVPKRIVPLATGRNRIKRLLREVVRKEAFFSSKKGTYLFRVLEAPGNLTLSEVQRTVGLLIKA